MHSEWIELKEARGCTVKKMTAVCEEKYFAVEVEVENGYGMNVDIVPAVQIRQICPSLLDSSKISTHKLTR